jgi:hypothetical protein
MIRALRILPPFAIGRLGSAAEPLDNYTIDDNPDQPLGYRRIVPQPTLVVDPDSGEITGAHTATEMAFKHEGRIRPVAPFLEVFAETDSGELVPLTLAMLKDQGIDASAIEWRVTVANRKIVRRTSNADDLIAADSGWFGGHAVQPLSGYSANFIDTRAKVDFGSARYIKPNAAFPGIRLRFTPAKGLIYGTKLDTVDKVIPPERAIYDSTKGWYKFGEEEDSGVRSAAGPKPEFFNETLPPSLYAIDPPAPSWLYDNRAVSRGYFDDTCDGFVEFRLNVPGGQAMTATARICAGPPALVPDSLFVRSLADDFEQIIHGPHVDSDEPDSQTLERAIDIVRRAYETVRFMNVAVMNGNDFKGRPALSLDSMPEEEAADTERSIRPIMGPQTVDTMAIMALHEQVYAALRGGAAAWFVNLLRLPDEVADFTDRGRRKMPALMCGADNNYLALTHRQISTIRKTVNDAVRMQPQTAKPSPLTPRNLSAQVNFEALGNPISSRPITSVANCCPGLEIDFRGAWRRMFKGLVLREYDNLVVDVDPGCPPEIARLKGHRLLRVYPPGRPKGIAMMTQITGPASSDPDGEVLLTTNMNPDGLAALEWSNALAHVLDSNDMKPMRCDFSEKPSWDMQTAWSNTPPNFISVSLEVRPFFDDDTAVISRVLADAGELTQGLCSPWQNDYRECSCYYWASARPDFVNVEPGANGLSSGDNWLQKERTGRYVPDDYADERLIHYDDLFEKWEDWLRFQLGGHDAPGETLGKKTRASN